LEKYRCRPVPRILRYEMGEEGPGVYEDSFHDRSWLSA
jgi:hypothetical protein